MTGGVQAASPMEPPSRAIIQILNQSGRRVLTAGVRRGVESVLKRHSSSVGAVCVLLTSDEHVRELNRQFRGVDESTDVLTFPVQTAPAEGDVAIAIPYAARQAKARGVSLSQEVAYLAIHGALHLCGFDDLTDQERAQMVSEMNIAALEAGLKPDEQWYSLLHEQEAAR